MKEKIQKFVQGKTFLIILSVLFALIVWLFVLNSSNPIKQATFTIPITYENTHMPSERDLINMQSMDSYPSSITVTVKGRQDTINNTLPGDFQVSVDFAEIQDIGVTSLKLSTPTCSRLGIKVEDYSPKELSFEFDKKMEVYLPIRIVCNDNLLKENYVFTKIYSEAESLPISGYASLIEDLEYVRVDVSDSLEAGSIDGNKTVSLLARYISKSGVDNTYHFDTEKVTVRVEVAKKVPIQFQLTGEAHEDYYVGGSSLSMPTILLQGNMDDLDAVSSIQLGSFAIDDAKKTVIEEISLESYIPEGLTVYGSNKTVLRVDILPYETKSFTIGINSLSKPGLESEQYEYRFTPESFVLQIQGKAEDLKTVTLASLLPYIDLKDKTVGEYKIPVQFTLDREKFTLVGNQEFLIDVVISNLPEPTPELEPTPASVTPHADELPATP